MESSAFNTSYPVDQIRNSQGLIFKLAVSMRMDLRHILQEKLRGQGKRMVFILLAW